MKAARKPNGCPYQNPRDGRCCHKGKTRIKGRKAYCFYKKPENCELFVEWKELKESVRRVSK